MSATGRIPAKVADRSPEILSKALFDTKIAVGNEKKIAVQLSN